MRKHAALVAFVSAVEAWCADGGLAPAAVGFIAPDASGAQALGAEARAAFEFARERAGATLLFATTSGVFVDGAGQAVPLERFRVLWIHQGDATAEGGAIGAPGALDRLRRFASDGGGLLVSGAALALVHAMGIEPTQPRLGGPGTDDYRASIAPAVPGHPIFEGLAVEGVILDDSVGGNPRVATIPIVEGGLPAFADFFGTGGPRGGRVLGAAPSGENPLVEYACGRGRVIAMGWRLAHFANARSRVRPNLERLTLNILRYLGDSQTWVAQRSEATAAGGTSGGMSEHDIESLELAIRDLAATFGARYSRAADYLAELADLAQAARRAGAPEPAKDLVERFGALRARALLDNPLLRDSRILLIQRGAANLGLPQNWQANSDLPATGYDNELAVLAPARPDGTLTPLFRPEGGRFAGDVDLHFDADRILFSMPGSNGRWQVFEMRLDGSAPRELPLIAEPDVDNYDACYLPDERIIFTSTAPFAGVPCVFGSSHVTNMYIRERDGSIRQLTVDQEHNWCPAVANDGRVLYLRWEYTDLPHSNSRILFAMNPDGTGQAEYFGSNSFFPNSFFYARPIPGHATMVAGIASGHHGTPRSGRLLLVDPARGRQEAGGVVQEIPGRGTVVPAEIRDNLVDDVWPQFLHPVPLSDTYFLVSAKPTPSASWGIYLVDVFDNMVLIKEVSGCALLEPLPIEKRRRPPAIPDRVDRSRKDAVVLMSDVYAGDGLKGVPRGTVKRLRLITYHYSYRGMGGLLGAIGMDGPWDIKGVLGTVPVERDGSAAFRVPANVPIAVQPLDERGQALQVMRSWFTAMPGENLSCVGCHERQNTSAPNRPSIAAERAPAEIEPWYGPPRGFAFHSEVQPVLDRHCASCHDGERRPGDAAPAPCYLRGDRMIADWRSGIAGSVSPEVGGKFSVAYADLHRFVRRPGIESDIRLLSPLEFHAEATELIQILRTGHHGVALDRESWDRLITWIDLNAPYHGTWGEIVGEAKARPQAERRRAMSRRYAGTDLDPESIPPVAKLGEPVAASVPPRAIAPPPSTAAAPNPPRTSSPSTKPAGATRRAIDLGGGVTMELVLIPPGEFVMGDPAGHDDERPAMVARIEQPFWLGAREVTNEEFARFDPSHDSRVEPMHGYQFGIRGYPVNKPTQPVVRVSWNRAMAFCEWLSRLSGQRFTLPAEAQWEYACRAGTTTEFWYGGTDADFSRFANLGDARLREFALDTYIQVHLVPNPNRYDDWVPKDDRFDDGSFVSAAAGTYAPNPWGLFDMHGNVAEWTRSAYAPYPYRTDDGRDREASPAASGYKVVRGGSWYDRPHRCRSASRLAYRAYQPAFNVGFRVAAVEE